MKRGNLALVLHAHLPYVRSEEPGSLEEDWFFQALVECYLPLLETLENSAQSKQDPKITIGLSPTLLSLLEDKQLKERFPEWVSIRLDLLENIDNSRRESSEHLLKHYKKQFDSWKLSKGNLIKRFSRLQQSEVVDILTCAATHGYLPLLRENPEAVTAQLRTAIREHSRLFGKNPLGIWLPECAYYEGLDELMAKAGLRYAILDGHGLLNATPRPRYGLYAPICSKNGVAFFGRDSEATHPVWSAKDGYPGNPEYREFHRDLGWELSEEELKRIGIKEPRPLGIKLNKVTSQSLPLDKKEIYNPKLATLRVKKDAKDYLIGRTEQLKKINQVIQIEPLLIAPFDAELFGHWWFEGPIFLSELFKQANEVKINFVRLVDVLKENPKIQLCQPCPSSWGQGGFHNYWLNDSNAWIVNEWSKAGKAMIETSTTEISKDSDLRVLQQAGRELLLSQSSDWSFILRAGTTTELAKDRIHLHLNRFWILLNSINQNKDLPERFLEDVEKEDCIFPLIHASDWSKVNSQIN